MLPAIARPASTRSLLLRGASLVALGGAVFGPAHAQAATASGNATSYQGPAGDANWSDGANWTNGVPNGGSDTTVNNAHTVNTDGGNATGTLAIGPVAGSQVNVADGTSLTVGATLANSGLLTLSGSYYGATLSLGGTTVSGTGAIVLNSGYDTLTGSGTVTNQSTIRGAGNLGAGQIGLANAAAGLVDANVSGATLTLQASGAGAGNAGVFRASDGGTLNLVNTAVTQNGGTILATGSGSTVLLTSSSVTGGTLATAASGTLALNNGGNALSGVTISGGSTLMVRDGTGTSLNGAITNSGSIALNGSYYGTTLSVASGNTATLSGGGSVVGNNYGGNTIGGSGTLVNVDTTIAGGLNLGTGSLHIDNRAGGLIDGNVSTALVVRDGTALSNAGTVRASAGGVLQVQGTVNQTGAGTILSTGAGSTATLSNATVNGGALATAAGGYLGSVGTTSLNNVTVTTGSTYSTQDGAVTYLGGTVTNNGTIQQNGTYYGTELRVGAGATTTLAGGGTVTLGGSGNNLIRDADAGTGVLVNLNNTIQGAGNVGNGQLSLDNRSGGTLNANVAGGALTLQANGGGTANAGLLQATAGGTLNVNGSSVTNAATGRILSTGQDANGNASRVLLTNTTVNNGTLSTANGGYLGTVGTTSLNNVTVTTGSTYSTQDGSTTYLGGTVTNNGTIQQNGSYYGTELRIGAGATTTLTGSGTVTLGSSGNNTVRDADTGTGTLVNANNTIQGAGQLGNGQLAIINQAAGTINANTGNTLVLHSNAGGIANAGLIEATGGGQGQVLGSTLTQTGGTLLSTGAGSSFLVTSSTVNGGTLTTANDGTLGTSGTSSLNNVTITAGSTYSTQDNATTYLGGTITNNGNIQQNGGYYGTELRVGAGATTTLTGGGTVTLGGGGNNLIRDADAGTGVLVNTDNTIQGAGNIGNGQLGIDNRAGGTINANTAGSTLVLQGNAPSNGNTNPTAVHNAGLAEATAGGILQVNGTTLNQTGAGTLLAANGSTVVLANSTVNGGTLTTTGTGSMVTSGTNSVNNATLSAGSTLSAQDGTTTYLGGTINNQGTVAVNGGYYGAELRVGAGATTTLTGGGTVTLTSSSAVRDADASTGTLNNADNTVQGAGTLGNGQLHVLNGGTILANAGSPLNLSTNGAGLTNTGTLQASNGATLNVTGGPLSNYAGGTLTGGTYRADANSTVNLNTAGITTNAATIVLNGTGSTINTQAGAVETTLTTNAGGGSLQILANRNYATANDLGNSGAIQLGGGTLAPNSLTNTATGTVTGFGAVAPTNGTALANAGTVTAAGGTLTLATGITGTGTLAANAGATANLASGPATNAVGILALNGGTLALGTNAVTVSSDYTNTAFGTGNSFNKRADVTGTGAVNAAGNTAQAVTGTTVVNGTTATPTLNLGDFHTTDAAHATGGATATFQVANTGTTGPSLRGAIQTTGITDGRLSGSGVTAGNFGPVAPGTSTSYTVNVAGSSAGALTNQSIHVANNFSNVAEQTVAITGTGYNYAQATNATGPTVNLGNFRVGTAQSATLDIGNTAPTGAYTEKLDGAAGATTGNATASGSFTGLAAGSSSNAIAVGLNTATAGAKAGTATLNFTSNAAGVDSLGNSALPSQTVAVTGNAFRLATGSAATPVSLGNVHVGDTAGTSLAVTNTAANDGFSEKLNAAVGGTTGAVSGTVGSVGLLGAGSTSNAITATLNTATAGAKSGTVTLNYASDGTGTTGAAATANGTGSVTLTGNVYNLASSSAIGNVNFGVLHTGTGTQTRTLSVTNTAAVGNYSEGLDTSFGAYTNTGGTIGVSTAGSITNLAAGATDSSSLSLAVSTAQAGTINGTVQVHQASNGTISGLASTALPDQNPGVSGSVQATATVTNLAQAQINTAQPISFGNVRIGTAQQQALSITNAAPASQYSEGLVAAVAGTSGGVTATGGFGPPSGVPSLAPQATDTTHVVVGINTATAGAKSGNATLNFQSDGTAFQGGTLTNLGNTDVAVTGTVYRLASPTVNTPSVTLAARVGGTASTAVSVTNTSPDSFTEGLKAGTAAAPANFTSSGSIGNLAAGSTDATTLRVGLNTGTSGTFTGTQSVSFASTGAGTTGAADAALASGSVALTGKVYAAAVASTPAGVNFGTVHVGDTVTRSLPVGNTATGALTDVLTGGFGTVSGGFTGTGTLGAGVAAGSTSNALTVGLNTSASGSYSGTAALALNSHDSDLADIAVAAGPVSLSGTVNNYALSGFGFTSGAGTFAGAANSYTLDFGTVMQGSTILMDTLYAGNFASGLADLLSGMFSSMGSSDFSLSGFDTFAGYAAGQTTGPLGISFGTGSLGAFTDTITLAGIGSNDSGYSGAVADTTLTLRGTVVAAGGGGGGTTPVPEPGTLAVLGSAVAALFAFRRRRPSALA